jgi:hypothetical protein
MTPEGKIKASIKQVLDDYNVYYFMPVQTGFGAAGVDFHCAVASDDESLAFFIEAKAPGKEVTERQSQFLKDRRQQQAATTFVIDGYVTLQELIDWLRKVADI